METILLEQKTRYSPNLRFQVRNGDTDVRVFVKYYDSRNYEPYREIDLNTILDDSVPNYESKTKYPKEKEDTVAESEGYVTPRKCGRSISLELRKQKKRVLSPVKLFNFLA